MSDEHYILSYAGECDRLERQSQLFGQERAFAMVAPAPGTRLLDAGCGSGWLSRLIAARMPDCEVVGVDINPDYVAYATTKAEAEGLANLSYRTASLTDLPFEEDHFDTVFSLMVMMFLPDRARALAELARVTRPGGRVIAAQQATTVHLSHPIDPGLDRHIKTFLALAMPDWQFERLPGLMRDAGLAQIDMRLETDPLYTFLGAATADQLDNLRNIAVPGAARMGDFLGDPAASASFADRWTAHAADPATNTITPFCIGTGIKP
jgi:ubiquinone/menaquinone biosynthesis C-methylase UbiE